jgi:hypothetical protein
VHAALAGTGALLVELWPVLLIWRAGASGSVGDLREARFVWVAVIYALGVAVVVGWLMHRALGRAAASARLGRLDPWGAWAVGVGVYNLALTAVPAIMYGLLLADENQSLRSREWLVYLIWIAGHVAAGVLGLLVARVWLGNDRDVD